MVKKVATKSFIESLKKQSCLFGTIRIKAAAAIITIIDLFLICNLDDALYHYKASDLQYNAFFSLIFLMLFTVLIGQWGLHRNQAWMLLPLIGIHLFVTSLIYLIFGFQIYNYFIFVLEKNIHLGRLLMFAVYRLIIGILCGYALFLLTRTYMLLRSLKKIEPMAISNDVFAERDDSEIIFFEHPKVRRPHNLVASPAPNSPNRTVKFTNVFGS